MPKGMVLNERPDQCARQAHSQQKPVSGLLPTCWADNLALRGSIAEQALHCSLVDARRQTAHPQTGHWGSRIKCHLCMSIGWRLCTLMPPACSYMRYTLGTDLLHVLSAQAKSSQQIDRHNRIAGLCPKAYTLNPSAHWAAHDRSLYSAKASCVPCILVESPCS